MPPWLPAKQFWLHNVDFFFLRCFEFGCFVLFLDLHPEVPAPSNAWQDPPSKCGSWRSKEVKKSMEDLHRLWLLTVERKTTTTFCMRGPKMFKLSMHCLVRAGENSSQVTLPHAAFLLHIKSSQLKEAYERLDSYIIVFACCSSFQSSWQILFLSISLLFCEGAMGVSLEWERPEFTSKESQQEGWAAQRQLKNGKRASQEVGAVSLFALLAWYLLFLFNFRFLHSSHWSLLVLIHPRYPDLPATWQNSGPSNKMSKWIAKNSISHFNPEPWICLCVLV